MNITIITYNKPRCKTCGREMGEWNPFATEHEHIECMAERISNKMVKVLIKQLKDEKIIKHNTINIQ